MASCHAAAVQHHWHLFAYGFLRDIGGACDNLHRLSLSHVNLAYHKFICIRMALNLKNLSDNDFFQVLIQTCITFYLCSCERHGIRVFLGRDIQIRDICFYP